jgi:hypothetical protein
MVLPAPNKSKSISIVFEKATMPIKNVHYTRREIVKKLIILITALAVASLTACQFGGNSEISQISQYVAADKEAENTEESIAKEIKESMPNTAKEVDESTSETEQNGVILFKIEGYTITENSVVLAGKKCGAFLRWTPDEDFVTTAEIPAGFDVPNAVEMDYYTEYVYHSVVEHKGGSLGNYFSNIYESVPIKADFVYLHLQNGQVVYIQQAQYVCY